MSEIEDLEIIPSIIRGLDLNIFRERPFIVFTGRESEYQFWIRYLGDIDNRMKVLGGHQIRRMFIYPYDINVIRGLHISGYTIYGSAFKRKDAHEILTLLDSFRLRNKLDKL